MMNILLPTDFSENSKNAASYAIQYFKEVPCTFHFLHVSPGAPEKLSNGHQTMPEDIQEKFEDLLSWIEQMKINKDHHFRICYKVNYLIEAVREKVLEKNIDLILMGTKGISNQKEIILGKNTADVIMKVKCPALAISEKAVYKSQQEILFPTDYKILYSKKMLDTLKMITNFSPTNFKILELYSTEQDPDEDQKNNKESLLDSLSEFDVYPAVQTYCPTKILDSTSQFKLNKQVDMIVMAAKNLNLCQKLLKDQNNSTQIPFIRKLPLLILHD